jgi:hypothetical protein
MQALYQNYTIYLMNQGQRTGEDHDDEAPPRFVEFLKAEYDFNKNLMTLNVAAIAFFGAVLGGLFKQLDAWPVDGRPGEISRGVITIVIFSCFIISIFLASRAAWLESKLILKEPRPDDPDAALAMLPKEGGFAAIWLQAGLVSFIYFAVLNSVVSGVFPKGVPVTIVYLVLVVLIVFMFISKLGWRRLSRWRSSTRKTGV